MNTPNSNDTDDEENSDNERNDYTEDDFINMINQVTDEIPPSTPWNFVRFLDTLDWINGLLANTYIDQDLQARIRDLINLGQEIQHPEALNADFLGLYFTNLARLLTIEDPSRSFNRI